MLSARSLRTRLQERTPEEFEHLIYQLAVRQWGREVRFVAAPDDGVDIWVPSHRLALQCKHFTNGVHFKQCLGSLEKALTSPMDPAQYLFVFSDDLTASEWARFDRDIVGAAPEIVDPHPWTLSDLLLLLEDHQGVAADELSLSLSSATTSRSAPPAPAPGLIGRDEELDRLLVQLRASARRGRAIVVHGLPGSGKSQVAAALLKRHAAALGSTYWVTGSDPAALRDGLRQIGCALSVPEVDLDEPTVVRSVTEALRESATPWCLIVDDVADPELLMAVAPVFGAGLVLATSVRTDWQGLHVDTHPLEPLALADAAQVIATRSGRPVSAAISALADELERLPLALEQAGALLCEATTLTVDGYRDQLRERAASVLRLGSVPSYGATTTAAFALCAERAATLAPHARDLLEWLSFLRPDSVPLALMLDAPGRPVALRDPLTAHAAEGALTRLSLLVAVTPGTVSMHRLVGSTLRTMLTRERRRTRATEMSTWLLSLVPDNTGRVAAQPYMRPIADHCVVVASHCEAEDSARLWEPAAELLTAAADFFRVSGRAMTARDLYEDAHEIADAHARGAPASIKYLNNFAAATVDGGQPALGAELHAEVYRRRGTLTDVSELVLARSLVNGGGALVDAGDAAGGLPMIEQALAIRQRDLPPDHGDLAWALYARGDALAALGHREASVADLEAALLIQEGAGCEPADAAWSHHKLAEVWLAMEDLEAALEHAQRAHTLRALVGERSALLADTEALYAEISAAGGNRGEARRRLGSAVEMGRVTLGRFHPKVVAWMQRLEELDSRTGTPGGSDPTG